jgi:hypothetical protein
MSVNCDPNALLEAARCYRCIPKGMQDEVITWLLCQVANQSGGGGGTNGTLIPYGLYNIDLSGDNGDTSLSFPNLTQTSIVNISGSPTLVSLDFPKLVSVTELDIDSDAALIHGNFPILFIITGGFDCDSCTSLVNLSLPSLSLVGLLFNASGCTSLQVIDLPQLGSASGGIDCSACPSLTSFNAPLLAVSNNTTITFLGDSLDHTSVELILRHCVISGVTTCTINLSGGTNAGLASLSAQGQTDYAALVTAGNTMAINP